MFGKEHEEFEQLQRLFYIKNHKASVGWFNLKLKIYSFRSVCHNLVACPCLVYSISLKNIFYLVKVVLMVLAIWSLIELEIRATG